MKRTMIILMALVLMAGAANAQDILWDQTEGYEGWAQGFFNVQAGAPPMGKRVSNLRLKTALRVRLLHPTHAIAEIPPMAG